MIDFTNTLNIELMIIDLLERNHVEDYDTLERYEEELHCIISNVCCGYADDEHIPDYCPMY